ncbi:MAG: hypothetical protein C0601_00510 [Candidatus Muiribacterium halophilum]|uniref:Aminotransferase class V domain-containing protein n=1 Tax=Muiribacterium halophilum TaxID=2053465 RepID=A0A2N5ZMT1_MUIH1|nr:MAG: hypothetical protein C0601_00510 [Candidatus Muirbacterium halophilum]
MKEMIYFDNASITMFKPGDSYNRIDRCLKECSSLGAGPNTTSMNAKRLIEESREKMNHLFNNNEDWDAFFGPSISFFVNRLFSLFLKKGSHIITTQIENDIVKEKLQSLSEAGLIEISYLPMSHEGNIDLQSLKASFRENTTLVYTSFVSGVNGAVIPVRDISNICKERSIPFAVDASLISGVLPVDLSESKIDILLTDCSRNLFSLNGLSCCFLKKELGFSDKFFSSEEENLSLPSLASLSGGLDYIKTKGIYNINNHLSKLVEVFVQNLIDIENIELLSGDKNIPIVSLKIDNPVNIASKLDENYGIMVSSGMFGESGAHRMLGIYPEGSIRFSFCALNTVNEIISATKILKELIQ